MTNSQGASPSPASMARTKPAASVLPNTAARRNKSALFEYAYIGKVRTSDERRAGIGEADYLDRLASLATPEDWDGSDANYADEKRILRNYVEHTFERIQHQEKLGTSESESYTAFNTGLSTPRQETIYGLFRRNSPDPEAWRFHGWQVESDRILLDNFATLPDFATYTDNPADYIFDWRRELKVNVRHVVVDNLARFPANLQGDAFGLELRLKAAVDFAKKRVQHNYKAAVPFWYPVQGQVQLLLPLSLLDPVKVDLALVVSRRGEFYRGDTVLTTGMAYNNARLLARPDGDWLHPAVSLDESGPVCPE